MILSQEALQKIKDLKLRLLLQEALGVVDQTIWKYAKRNEPNSLLTTYTVVKLIQEYTGMPLNKILIDEKTVKSKKNSAVAPTR